MARSRSTASPAEAAQIAAEIRTRNPEAIRARRGPDYYQYRINTNIARGRTRQQARGHGAGESGTVAYIKSRVGRRGSLTNTGTIEQSALDWAEAHPTAARAAARRITTQKRRIQTAVVKSAARMSRSEWEGGFADPMFADMPSEALNYGDDSVA